MRLARPAHVGLARLGIGLLILGLLHVPLPEPDYHNVRHHDAPGEVCEHHDHLLRWHPGATQAQDVAIFHWHWIVPGTDPSGLAVPGEGAALHAHAVGWDAPTIDAPALIVSGPGPGRLVAAVPHLLDPGPALLPPAADLAPPRSLGPPSARAFGATFAPGVSLPCLLQRWTC